MINDYLNVLYIGIYNFGATHKLHCVALPNQQTLILFDSIYLLVYYGRYYVLILVYYLSFS